MSKKILTCRCDKEIQIVKSEGKYVAECKDCNLKATSVTSVTTLQDYWRNLGGKLSGSSREEIRAKNRENRAKKSIEYGTIEHFCDKVQADTRARLMRDHQKMKPRLANKSIQYVNVHEIDDDKLDSFSEIKVSETENGKHTIVQVGPKKKFLISKATKAITSENRKEFYGTLDTIDEWDWSGFYPCKKDAIWRNGGVSMKTPAINGKRDIFK